MKIKILTKTMVLILILTIVPITLLGYLALNDSKTFGYDAADKSALALKEEAETNIQIQVFNDAEKINSFFSEAENDLKGFAKNIYTINNDPRLWNIEYQGEPFAFWATNAWINHTDKDRIRGILDGSIKDDNYDFVMGLLNETQKTAFIQTLTTLSGSYTVLTPKNMPINSPEFIPRFMISKDFFFNLQLQVGEVVEKSETPLALVNFMFSLLDTKAQSELRKGMNILRFGTSTIDTHPEYKNIRMGYWGNGVDSIEFVYAGNSQAYHPATNGIGNSYYCKSPFALRKSGKAETVWVTELLDTNSKVSTAIYPVFDKFDDSSTEMIGFAEYWIDWDSISEQIVNLKIVKTGYMLMIDQTGKIISHPKKEMFGKNFTEEKNVELESVTKKMKAGEKGISTLNYEGKEVYVVYSPIKETKWSVIAIVPVEEIIEPSELIRDKIRSQINILQNTTQWIILITIIIVIMISYLFAKTITLPIRMLSEAGKQISEGKLDTQLPNIKSNDEIGELGQALNDMTDKLKQSKKEMQDYAEELEKKIALRTMELNKKIEELENQKNK
jgi:HAMP domain-containing protein